MLSNPVWLQARGLITFLFAFATIAIMLLVAITTFWMPKDDVQVRFEKAKDLLTILIAVIGTILGFYFGTLAADGNIRPRPTRPLFWSRVTILERFTLR